MEIEDIPKWLKQVVIGGAIASAGAGYLLYRELSKVKPHDYIRFENNALEIAVKTFSHAETGISVDLAGAIHIADDSFFQDVQDHLDSLDVVLWEAVRSNQKQVQPSNNQMDLLKRMYILMANELGLAYQMDAIDYENLPEVWEHCDMSLEDVAQHGGLLYSDKFSSNPQMKQLFEMLSDELDAMEQELNNRRSASGGMFTKMKPRLAEGFAYESDSKLMKKIQYALPDLLLGKGVILDKRNGVVCDRIKELTELGEPTHIGVFYGAAHLPGMEEYLLEELGYELTGEQWITAWDCN